jgi:hypothetical protein
MLSKVFSFIIFLTINYQVNAAAPPLVSDSIKVTVQETAIKPPTYTSKGWVFPNDLHSKLPYNTVRMFTTFEDKQTTVGTGFVIDYSEPTCASTTLKFDSDRPLQSKKYLVTCLHCVLPSQPVSKGGIQVEVFFGDKNASPSTPHNMVRATISIPYTKYAKEMKIPAQTSVEWDEKEKEWSIYGQDIAIYQIEEILNKAKREINRLNTNGQDYFPLVYALRLQPDVLATASINSSNYYSKIFMYGYPKGFSTQSGKPLLRTGHCSTDPREKASTRYDFASDIADLPGSSGSPVFLEDNSPTEDRLANIDMVASNTFAGMFFASPELNMERQAYRHIGLNLSRESILSLFADSQAKKTIERSCRACAVARIRIE